jgi:hypothetical protein
MSCVYFRGDLGRDYSPKKNVFHPEKVYLFINHLLLWHIAYYISPSPEIEGLK